MVGHMAAIGRVILSISLLSSFMMGMRISPGRLVHRRWLHPSSTSLYCSSSHPSSPSSYVPFLLPKARNDKEFLRILSDLSQATKKPDSEAMTSIISEVDFKLNTFDFKTLAEVIYVISFLDMRSIETSPEVLGQLKSVYADAVDAYVRIVHGNAAGASQISPIAVRKFYHGLANAKHFKWTSLPYSSRETLLTHISTIMLSDSEISTVCAAVPLTITKRMMLVTNILQSLSRIHGNIHKEFSPNFTAILFDFIGKQSYPDTSIVKMIQAISSLKFSWVDLPNRTQTTILTSAENCINNLTQNELSSVISSFGFLRLPLQYTSSSFQNAILNNLLRIVSLSSASSLGFILQSLGKMSYRWSMLPPELQLLIYDRVESLSPYPPAVLSSLLLGFKSLEIHYIKLPQSLRDELESSIPSPEVTTEQAISNIVYALGGMHAQWSSSSNDLKKETQRRLLYGIHHASQNLTIQGTSNIMWGLARMSVKWDEDIELLIRDNLEIKLARVLPKCNEQSLSSIVWAMGVMTMRIQNETVNVLMDTVAEFLSGRQISEQAVANILYGMARLGAKKHEISLLMQARVYACIVEVSPKMTTQAVSNTLYALSQMGFQWQDICSDARKTLISAIIRQHSRFNQQGLSMTLFSLGRMNVLNSMDLPENHASISGVNGENDHFFLSLLADALVKKGPKMGTQQLANSLHGLGRLSLLAGPSLNSASRQVLLTAAAIKSANMTEQEIGNTVWGLGQIGAQFSSSSNSQVCILYNSIVNLDSLLQRQAIVAILQGLSSSNDLVWSNLSRELRDVLTRNVDRNIVSSSTSSSEDAKFVSNIMNCLGRLQAEWNCRNDLSAEFKSTLLKTLDAFKLYGEKEQAGEILSLATNGLCRMGASWEEISEIFELNSSSNSTEHNNSVFSESISITSTNELANILWSWGMRRTPWTKVRGSIGDAALSRFIMIGKGMSAHEFIWSLWAFARMGMRWSEDFDGDQCSDIMQLAADAVETQSMSEREIGVLLWALVKLQTPPQEFSRSLKRLFVENIEYILMTRNKSGAA